MCTREVTISNPSGLHARPASEFTQCAKQFRSKIWVSRAEMPEQTANAKSILILLSMALTKGTNIILTADGEDEKEAVSELAKLIESGFGET